MNDQLGFGFLFKGERLYWDRTVDDWQPSKFTPEGYAKQLQLARERLQNVLWPAQEICRQGIEACSANLVRMMKPVAFGPDEPRTWPSVTLEVGVKQQTEFVQHCIDMVDGDWDSPGLEFKVCTKVHRKRIGMYHCQVGSVIVTIWSDGLAAVDFSICKASLF